MKKLVNDEEVVFRYIDIDTGEVSYELREEIQSELIRENQKKIGQIIDE